MVNQELRRSTLEVLEWMIIQKQKIKTNASRYLRRHRARENWSVPDTAGSLSKHILWGDSTSRKENINKFKKKFKLK